MNENGNINNFHKEEVLKGRLNKIALWSVRIGIAILTFFALLAETSSLDLGEDLFKTIKLSGYIIQIFFALIIVIIGNPIPVEWGHQKFKNKIYKSAYFRNRKGKREELSHSIESLRGWFAKSWYWMWFSWVILYLWLLLVLILTNQSSEIGIGKNWIDWISNCLNAFGTVFMYRLYISVTYRTNSSSKDSYKWEKNMATFLIVVIVPLLFEMMILILYSLIDVNNLSNEILLISDVFQDITIDVILRILKISNGLTASVVFAMLIGRFIDSHSIKIANKNWILPALYCYAGLQVLYPNIVEDDSDLIEFIIIILALAFKYILYHVISSLVRTKAILFYFLESRLRIEELNSNFSDFMNLWNKKSKKNK